MRHIERGFRLERTLIELLPERIHPDVLPTGQELQWQLSDRHSVEVNELLSELAKMTEWARQRFFAQLAEAPQGPRTFWLWALGNYFVEHGHHALAAGAFGQAAVTERLHEITRATLLIKAGAASISGSLGSAADQWLVNGMTVLERIGQAPKRPLVELGPRLRARLPD